MTTRAYPEIYLSDAMNALGDLLDYAVCDLGYDPEVFFQRFLISGIATFFGNGNPKYLVGLSGPELAGQVLFRTEGQYPAARVSESIEKSPAYWAGWALAYYQWQTALRFSYLYKHGLNMNSLLSLYPTLHEADLSKFTEVADHIIQESRSSAKSNLQQMRRLCDFTQKELAQVSGVSLRMIQLYEQGQQDIAKAESQTLIRLAKALGCDPEALLE